MAVFGAYILVMIVAAGAGWFLLQQQKRVQSVVHDYKMLEKAHAKTRREIDQMRFTIASLQKTQPDPDSAGQDGTLTDEDKERMMLEKAVANLAKTQGKSSASDAPKKAKGDGSRADRLSDREVLRIVDEAIKTNSIDLTLQPIMQVEFERIVHYEVFSRIRAGEIGFISAGRFISLAGDNKDLITAIDSLLLLRCLQLIRGAKTSDFSRSYFVNIAIESLKNPDFITTLADYLREHPRLSSRLVFEMSQKDLRQEGRRIRPIIDNLTLLGCRFSMDRVDDTQLDLEELMRYGISYIKLGAPMLELATKDKKLKEQVIKTRELLEESGIEIIAEKLETDMQLSAVKALEISNAQGYLLAKPR